ncbi:MAG TPA: spore coat U domain-containing protein [Pseudolabrys sp.]|nr:spore coat U domain-containing protein [Pseudolabrys sp.]
MTEPRWGCNQLVQAADTSPQPQAASEDRSSCCGKLTFISGDAHAATATSNFTVQLTITASCTIGSASTLDFGSQGVLTSAIDQTGTIAVQCTNTTPFNIGLDAGNGAGTTVTTRKMIGAGGATVAYALYSDSGRTSNWGNTPGVDAISSTGTGAAQSFTVFGRVPAQATPAPATYTDTVTVTVTY